MVLSGVSSLACCACLACRAAGPFFGAAPRQYRIELSAYSEVHVALGGWVHAHTLDWLLHSFRQGQGRPAALAASDGRSLVVLWRWLDLYGFGVGLLVALDCWRIANCGLLTGRVVVPVGMHYGQPNTGTNTQYVTMF